MTTEGYPTPSSSGAAALDGLGDASQSHRSSSAARMRRLRARRQSGVRSVAFDIRLSEIEGLVKRGLLAPDARNNADAIARALGKLLDGVRW